MPPDGGEAEDFADLGPPPPPPLPMISVQKDVDADGDGTLGGSETAPGSGTTVVFRVVIHNDGSDSVTITGLTDESPPGSNPQPVCPQLIGVVIPPSGQEVCTFTVTNYSQPGWRSRWTSSSGPWK